MRARTMAGVLLATVLVLNACGKENEESEGKEANEAPAVAMAAAPDSAELAEQAALAKEAEIAEPVARATALKAVPGGTFSKVELEKEDSLLVYSYDIIIAGKDGVEEVKVDAKTGKVVSNQHESAADEAQEKAEDARKAAAKTPATKKGG